MFFCLASLPLLPRGILEQIKHFLGAFLFGGDEERAEFARHPETDGTALTK